MLVRIARIGTGLSGDTFRVPLPTYSVVLDDVAGSNHIVDVPDADFPSGLIGNPGLVITALAVGNTITGIPPNILAQWIGHLQNRYGRAYNPVIR